jgi:cytochrome c oxidase subunit IV
MKTQAVIAEKTYFTVWGALLLLLLLSFGSAYIPLGTLNVIINLGISTAKVLLVMFFFMHLRSSNALLRIIAFAAYCWLLVLVSLTLSDVLSR